MATIRTETIHGCWTREKNIKVCDICGADATDRFPCVICKKDLCPEHQFDISGILTYNYNSPNQKVLRADVYCADCLIEWVKTIRDSK